VFPDVVTKGKDGMMAVEYDSLVGPMIEAIRELKTQNDDLRDQVSAMSDMQTQLTEIRATLKDLKAENQQLKSVRAEAPLVANQSVSVDH
jgi:septal ring factor EnvC (AmiA/AmiB activator)